MALWRTITAGTSWPSMTLRLGKELNTNGQELLQLKLDKTDGYLESSADVCARYFSFSMLKLQTRTPSTIDNRFEPR